MSDSLRIRSGGRRFEGWKGFAVSRSLEFGASTLDLDVASWPDDAELHLEDDAVAEIVDADTGEAIVVWTGILETFDEDEEATNHGAKLSGRSPVGQLSDCSAVLGSHKGLTLLELARRLAAPFGVEVDADTDVGPPLALHRVQPGEKVFDCIERAARRRGVLVTDRPDGRLLLTAASSRMAAGAIVVGQNAKSVRRRLSVADRYQRYRVAGQRPTPEDALVDVQVDVSDPGVRRNRTLLITGESDVDGASARTRALVEAARRIGQGVRHTFVVVGWRQWDGALWEPNTIVQVTDDRIGYQAQEFLIVSVTYELGDEGELTRIEVAPRVAFARPAEALVLPAGLEGRWGTRQAARGLPPARRR